MQLRATGKLLIIILHPLELYDFLVQTRQMQPIPEDALMDEQLAIHYVEVPDGRASSYFQT